MCEEILFIFTIVKNEKRRLDLFHILKVKKAFQNINLSHLIECIIFKDILSAYLYKQNYVNIY